MVDDNIRFDIRARDRSGPAFASVNRSLQRTSRSLVAIGRAGTAAFAAFGGAAVLRSVQRTVDAVAAIGDTADRVNVSAEALQAYRFALEENGGEARQLDDSLQRLNRRLGLAADNAGPAVKAFERLGIELRDVDGRVRDTDPVFREAIERLSQLETAAEQAAVASLLFGEDSGPKLVPLISQGVAGLERYENQARDLGRVLSEDLVDSAQVTAREFARLVDVITVKFQEFVIGTVDFGKSVIEALSSDEEPGLVQTIEQLNAVIGSLQTSLAIVESGPPSGRGRIRDITADLAAAKAEAESLAGFLRLVDQARANAGAGGAAAGAPGSGGPDASFSTQSQQVIDSLTFQQEQLGRTNAEQRIYNELRAAGVEIDSAAGEQIAALATEIERASEAEKAATDAAREANAATLEAGRIYEATRTPAEAYADEIERLDKLLADEVINEELHARAVELAADRMADAAEKGRDLAGVVGDELGGAVGRTIQNYKDWKRIALSAIGDIISETIRLKTVQASAGPGGSAGGGGGSPVGAIVTGIIGGLFGQHGLSFRVGGAGGPDSQFVPLMLSPNERVDVRTPSQVRQGESRSGAGGFTFIQHIDARGADPQSAANLRAEGQRIEDSAVRRIIEGANQGGATAFALGRRRR